MGTTTHGFPYPEPTDTVALTDQAIQDLADAIEVRLPVTKMRTASQVANTDGAGVITIPHGGGGASPAMYWATSTTASTRVIQPGAMDPTNLTFTVRNLSDGSTVNSTAMNIRWVALWF